MLGKLHAAQHYITAILQVYMLLHDGYVRSRSWARRAASISLAITFQCALVKIAITRVYVCITIAHVHMTNVGDFLFGS